MTLPATNRHIYWTLFSTFFKIGLFTFGGGYAMIPLMEKEVVEHQKWFSAEEVVDMIAVAQSLPGPIAVNTAAFIGRRMAGRRGALIGLLGCALPAVLVILVVAAFLVNYQDNPVVKNVFRGVRAAVTALILAAGLRLAKKSVHDALTLLITAATIIVVSFLKVPALLAILTGALIGVLYGQVWLPLIRKKVTPPDPEPTQQEKEEEIDDHARTR